MSSKLWLINPYKAFCRFEHSLVDGRKLFPSLVLHLKRWHGPCVKGIPHPWRPEPCTTWRREGGLGVTFPEEVCMCTTQVGQEDIHIPQGIPPSSPVFFPLMIKWQLREVLGPTLINNGGFWCSGRLDLLGLLGSNRAEWLYVVLVKPHLQSELFLVTPDFRPECENVFSVRTRDH